MMFDYLKEHPDKRTLVDQMGFGALSHLPNKNLNQRLLKQLFDHYDIYDNTIYSGAATVKITTRKIEDALGLSSNGTAYDTRVVRKKLSQADKETHKLFQGKSAVALQNLIKSTPLDTDDNRKLFMRSFICFIQKVFLLPNSTANISPTALPAIFDLETTRSRNWALHVHNFLLQELKKAKQNNSVAIHGCVMGLLKTGEMIAKKDMLEKKKTTMRVPSSNRDIELDSESYKSSSTDSDSESSSSSDSESDSDPDSKHAIHEEPPPQQEMRSKKKNNRAVVGSNEPLNITQQSVAVPGVLQAESEQHEKTNDAEVEVEDATVEVPPIMKNVVQEELQPKPLVVIMPIQPEQPSKSRDAEVEVPPPIVENVVHEEIQPEPLVVIMPLQPEQQSGGTTEVEPEPINIQIPLELELTLRPWLQPEAETSAAKGPIESSDEIITHMLLNMNQEGPSTQDGNQIQQPKDEDQCKTPETTPVSLKERCFIWATMENDNKYETIFQLRWPNTIEAMRYNFMTMAPETCIDMQMVSLVCHILNKEELQRFQRDVYCVPPKILIRMFQTYGRNYLDKKTKMPYLVSQLKDQHYMKLLDKEKLRKHSTLRCIDVPKQPNPTDCGVYVMKWMELLEVAVLLAAYTFKLRYSIEEWTQDQLDQFRKEIVSKLIMRKDNTLNVEAINQASNMTLEAIT
ncbi:hypothetical protein PIB30_081731 [Stylosanthes scabra]|uniref:Ubiquitin-like protease family profile domain-containing protein n=1 Tax=Stylosanthes scabra TaxID=79078 RepID=A0ABU6SRY4_9FABA|nr:hypothetical protein [Stylosanthes scabra]